MEEPSPGGPLHTPFFHLSLYVLARGDSGRGLPGAPDNALDTYVCQRPRRLAFPGAPALYFHAQLFVCREGCSPGLRWPVGVSISGYSNNTFEETQTEQSTGGFPFERVPTSRQPLTLRPVRHAKQVQKLSLYWLCCGNKVELYMHSEIAERARKEGGENKPAKVRSGV